MLDIIASQAQIHLQCPLLPVVRFIPWKYQPETHHDGADISHYPPYALYKDFNECVLHGQLYYIKLKAGNIKLIPYSLVRMPLSLDLPPEYCEVPNFGFKSGKVVWISREAFNRFGKDEALNKLKVYITELNAVRN